jgi:hypothetical protein
MEPKKKNLDVMKDVQETENKKREILGMQS